MSIFAEFDENGFPASFYDERVHGPKTIPRFGVTPEPTEEAPDPLPPVIGYEPNPDCKIPANAVELTQEQYTELINNAGLRRWQDGQVVDYSPPIPAPTGELVNVERDRRIAAGVTVNVTGIGDVPMTGRQEDQVTILALKDTARDMKVAGITDAIIPYRDGTNTDHMMTPDQIIEMADKGKAWVTAIYQASWALKAMDPIPADFTDDQYWSSTPEASLGQ